MKKSIKKVLKTILVILILLLICIAIYLIGFVLKLKKYEPCENDNYYSPYYVYISNKVKKKLDNGENVNILVLPNNTMGVTDNNTKKEMFSMFHALVGHTMFKDLNTIILVPIFPRPEKYNIIYTHALDRDVMTTDVKLLKRLDLQLIEMIDEVINRNKNWKIDKKVLMWGFSASGMFTNRFTLLHPDRVKASVVGSPGGWPIAPVDKWQNNFLRYPIGTGDIESLTNVNLDFDTYRQVPQLLFLGDKDTNDSVPYDDGYENQDENLINNLFGDTPVERWKYAEKIYKQNQINAQFKLYKGVGHMPSLDSFKDAKQFFISSISYNSYVDKDFDFKVKFPKEWSYEVSERWEATSDFEANPDGGITIYIDNNKNDSIYVFRQRGHIGIPNESQQYKEEFETNDGVKGNLLYNDYEDRKEIELILANGFYGAHVNTSIKCFNNKKQEIMNILKNIEIIE